MGQTQNNQEIKDDYQIKKVRQDGSVMLQHRKSGQQFLLRNICTNIEEELKGFHELLLKRQKIQSPHLLDLSQVRTKQQKVVCSIVHKIYLLIEYPFKSLNDEIQQKRAQGTKKNNKLGIAVPRNPFGEAQLWSILYSCCVGLNKIYENKLAHESLSSGQIYITKGGLIKISDPLLLGLEKNYIRILRNDGDKVYVSPQIMNFLDDCTFSFYDKQKSDVYVLGAILLQAALLKNIEIYDYHHKRPNLQIVPKLLDQLRHQYSCQFYDMLSSMMQLHAKMRPTLTQIVKKIQQDNTLADETIETEAANYTTQSSFKNNNANNQPVDCTPTNNNRIYEYSSSKNNLVQPFHASPNNNSSQYSSHQPHLASQIPNNFQEHSMKQKSNQKFYSSSFNNKKGNDKLCEEPNNSQPVSVQFPFKKAPENKNTYSKPYNEPQFCNNTQFYSPHPSNGQQPSYQVSNSNTSSNRYNEQPKQVYFNLIPQQSPNTNMLYSQYTSFSSSEPFFQIPHHDTNNQYQPKYQKKIQTSKYEKYTVQQIRNTVQKQNILHSSVSTPNLTSYQMNQFQQKSQNNMKINPPQRSPGGYEQNTKKYSPTHNYPPPHAQSHIKYNESKTNANTKPQSVDRPEQVYNKGQINSNSNTAKFMSLILNQGGKYQGYIKNGMKHGKGRLEFKDGGFYQGDWVNDKMEGHGRLHYQNGQIAYEGEWVNDEFNGKGKVFNDRPQKILGAFNYYDFADLGDRWIYYQGQFRSDSKHGLGKLKLSNGELFHGNFIQDTIQGEGVFYNLKGQAIQGRWNDNILVTEQQQ